MPERRGVAWAAALAVVLVAVPSASASRFLQHGIFDDSQILYGNPDQTFPVLTAAEIARIQRFGKFAQYSRGERLVVAGQPGPGMLVVLKGAVTIRF